MQTYFNPVSYQYDMASILNTYRQRNWQGMLAYGGTAYVPAAGSYQFATASFNTAKTAQQTIQSLTAQRQNLQPQRDSALQSLQSATTQSDVQKRTAVSQTLKQLDQPYRRADSAGDSAAGTTVGRPDCVSSDSAGAARRIDAQWSGAGSRIV